MKNSFRVFVNGKQCEVDDYQVSVRRDKITGNKIIETLTREDIIGLDGKFLDGENSKINVIIELMGNDYLAKTESVGKLDCTKSDSFKFIDDIIKFTFNIQMKYENIMAGYKKPNVNICDEWWEMRENLRFLKKMLADMRPNHGEHYNIPKPIPFPIRNEIDFLQFCVVPKTRDEIEQYFQGKLSRKRIMAKIVRPLVESGKLNLSIPSKPTSINQKYYS